jgi:hypothetical protein
MPIMRHHLLSYPDDAAAHGRDDQYLFGPDILVAPVLQEGAYDRAVYLPQGQWIEWWRSVNYADASGAFSLGALRMHPGEAEIVVDAPREEIPLFVRAGAIIPLLPPDVDTLAEHGAGSPVIRLVEREHLLHLLAFPRGSSAGRFYETGDYRSEETRGGWTLALKDSAPRTVHLQANLQSLETPFTPCRVRSGEQTLRNGVDWHYDAATAVLQATFASDAGALTVEEC